MTDVAPQQDPETGRFVAGNGGNGGRKKGSRNKLGQAFIDALYADFQEHGETVIQQVRAERPHEYLKVIAGILPQKIEIERYDNLSEDERSNRIRELAEQLGLAAALGLAGGTASAAGSREAASGSDAAAPVQTLQ